MGDVQNADRNNDVLTREAAIRDPFNSIQTTPLDEQNGAIDQNEDRVTERDKC